MKSVAERLKQALDLRKLTQADLVKKTGISKSSISTYLSGEYEPKQKNLYKISKALDINEGWLMGLDVDIERKENTINLSNRELNLLNTFNCLNDVGKNEAQKRIEELTLIDKYKISNNLETEATETNDIYITEVAARGDSKQKVKLSKKTVAEDMKKPMSTSYDD